MSWLITGTYKGAAVSDPDAQAYLRAVEQADNQGPLEQGVQQALNQFVIGCKQDGIWPAIKASCILAGARTLTGALVPLVGPAPTNNNFVSGDYNRKTGLVGDGSTKILNSNRNNNADPQNNQHLACFATTLSTNTRFMGSGAATGSSALSQSSADVGFIRSRNNGVVSTSTTLLPGFFGKSRSESLTVQARLSNVTVAVSQTSQEPENATIEIFRGAAAPSSCRLAFYSIGESLDLALLDARVTTLIQAIDAAI